MFDKERKKTNIELQISGKEIPGSRKFLQCHQVLLQPQIIVSSLKLFSKGDFTFG